MSSDSCVPSPVGGFKGQEVVAVGGGREVGRATSSFGLTEWSDEKLVTEVRKQIRCDVGGRDMHAHCVTIVRSLLGGVSVPSGVVDYLAGAMVLFGKDATEGSRKRVESKLREISYRLEGRENLVRYEGERVARLSKELEVLRAECGALRLEVGDLRVFRDNCDGLVGGLGSSE